MELQSNSHASEFSKIEIDCFTMPSISVSKTFVLVLIISTTIGCTSIIGPRSVPGIYGVSQIPGSSIHYPSEYLFCDVSLGKWNCEQTSKKTPLNIQEKQNSSATDKHSKSGGGISPRYVIPEENTNEIEQEQHLDQTPSNNPMEVVPEAFELQPSMLIETETDEWIEITGSNTENRNGMIKDRDRINSLIQMYQQMYQGRIRKTMTSPQNSVIELDDVIGTKTNEFHGDTSKRLVRVLKKKAGNVNNTALLQDDLIRTNENPELIRNNFGDRKNISDTFDETIDALLEHNIPSGNIKIYRVPEHALDEISDSIEHRDDKQTYLNPEHALDLLAYSAFASIQYKNYLETEHVLDSIAESYQISDYEFSENDFMFASNVSNESGDKHEQNNIETDVDHIHAIQTSNKIRRSLLDTSEYESESNHNRTRLFKMYKPSSESTDDSLLNPLVVLQSGFVNTTDLNKVTDGVKRFSRSGISAIVHYTNRYYEMVLRGLEDDLNRSKVAAVQVVFNYSLNNSIDTLLDIGPALANAWTHFSDHMASSRINRLHEKRFGINHLNSSTGSPHTLAEKNSFSDQAPNANRQNPDSEEAHYWYSIQAYQE